MTLIKNQIAVADEWRSFDDDEALPEGASVIVSLDRWRAQDRDLASHFGPIGIRLAADDDLTPLIDDLYQISLITIEFSTFTDGRGYSLARLLRQRYGYLGELRAVGQVLRDQISALIRCGFDAFEVDTDPSQNSLVETAKQITHWYQDDTINSPSVLHLRHAGVGKRPEPPAYAAAWAY